jgi:hypothetical protein
MSTNAGQIQPVASGPMVVPEPQNHEVQSIPPVTGTEGGTTSKVGDFRTYSGADSLEPPLGFSEEFVQQIQSFLKENMDIELGFVADEDGSTVVQILDSKTGKLIRKIPLEKVSRFRDKMAKLRGILFDGKA